MKKLSLIFLFVVVVAVSSCKGNSVREPGAAPNVSRQTVFFPQNIIVIGSDNAPTPLKVRSGPDANWTPEDLNQAIDELIAMFPEAVSSGEPVHAETTTCQLEIPEDSDRFELCEKSQCNRLPEVYRGPSCIFFYQLARWTKENWLGSICYSNNNGQKSKLEEWLSKRNSTSCTVNSLIIESGLFMRLAKVDFNQDELTRRYAEYYRVPSE